MPSSEARPPTVTPQPHAASSESSAQRFALCDEPSTSGNRAVFSLADDDALAEFVRNTGSPPPPISSPPAPAAVPHPRFPPPRGDAPAAAASLDPLKAAHRSRRNSASICSAVGTPAARFLDRPWLGLDGNTPGGQPGLTPPVISPVTDTSSVPADLVGIDASQIGATRITPFISDVDVAQPGVTLLGRGAYGTVLGIRTAADGSPCDPFARKCIPLFSFDAVSTALVRTELRVAHRVLALSASLPEDSPLLRVTAVHVGQTVAAIDMELLDAGPISRFVPLPDEACVATVARQLLLGLQVLHDVVGVLHRDVKCSNVMCSRTGVAKLIDFGSAAMLPDDAAANAPLVATDQKGSIIQMPPERLRGEEHGPASDVWSFGVTIAELATGAHPFVPRGETLLDGSTERFWRLAEVLRHTASPEECAVATRAALDRALRETSPAFRDFVGQAVRADPAKRASVSDLLLHPFLAGVARDDERFAKVLSGS